MSKYSFLHFPPPLSLTPPTPTSHPQSYPPLAFSMCPLYVFLDGPPPIFPHYPSSPSPLVTVSLFFIPMSLLIFCLLVCFVDYFPLIGDIMWFLSYTTCLISLSIILSGSIHAVVKGSIPLCKCTIVF